MHISHLQILAASSPELAPYVRAPARDRPHHFGLIKQMRHHNTHRMDHCNVSESLGEEPRMPGCSATCIEFDWESGHKNALFEYRCQ